MEDRDIVELYWQRSDDAIAESSRKYGSYCSHIAFNICGTNEDAEECVNDTWLRAWKLMPDKRPTILSSFLGCITRSISLDKLKAAKRQKRGNGQIPLIMDELENCISDESSPEKAIELKELETAVKEFVGKLPETEKKVFIARYFYLAPMSEIADSLGCSQSKIKSTLFRSRSKLKAFLIEEGLC